MELPTSFLWNNKIQKETPCVLVLFCRGNLQCQALYKFTTSLGAMWIKVRSWKFLLRQTPIYRKGRVNNFVTIRGRKYIVVIISGPQLPDPTLWFSYRIFISIILVSRICTNLNLFPFQPCLAFHYNTNCVNTVITISFFSLSLSSIVRISLTLCLIFL